MIKGYGGQNRASQSLEHEINNPISSGPVHIKIQIVILFLNE